MRDSTERRRRDVPDGYTRMRRVGSSTMVTRRQISTMETIQQQPIRNEWLAAVAHELRNPLTAIQCAVRVLKEPGQERSVLAQAQALIDRQVLQIARISDDLLNAGHLTAGRFDLLYERIDLRDIIRDVIDGCRAQIDAGNHELILRLPDEPVLLDVDPVRMTQVFANLIDNAAKYSPHGHAIVVCMQIRMSEVSICIVDDGMGIAAEMLPRIFDPFVRADQAKLHCRQGIGIGLCVVRRIVELHRGTVEAFSAGVGLGSTFRIRLPRNI